MKEISMTYEASTPNPNPPPMDFGAAVDFLATVNAHVDCPICKAHEGWTIVARLEAAGTHANYPGLVGAREDRHPYLAIGFPVITVSCNNCGFMRLHDLASIRRKQAAQKAQADEEAKRE